MDEYASEAVRRIDIPFEIERTINAKMPEQLLAGDKSRPIVVDLEIWMRQQCTLLSSATILQRRSTTSLPLSGATRRFPVVETNQQITPAAPGRQTGRKARRRWGRSFGRATPSLRTVPIGAVSS